MINFLFSFIFSFIIFLNSFRNLIFISFETTKLPPREITKKIIHFINYKSNFIMLKEFILKRNKNYKFKITEIKGASGKLLNLIKKNIKNSTADKKFLEKLNKVDKKILGNFLFILRSLDFQLWSFIQNWQYKNDKGFFGLMERVIDLFCIINTNNKQINFALFKKIISPKENLTLTKIRYKIFKSALDWLEKYDNSFDNYFEENKNGYDFCINLFNLEKYRDFYKNFYFLKPNQLLYLEYILAKGLIKKYKDELESLTIFADYKIPQIFINFGLIGLPEIYLRKLKEGKIIKKFSLLENELRLASILLGEELSKKLKIPSYKIDNTLWWLSHKMKLKIPAPKVKTIFY